MYTNTSSQNILVPLFFFFFLSLQLAKINLLLQNCFNMPLMAMVGGMWALLTLCYIDMSRHMRKPTKWPVHPAMTQISLGIRPVFAVHMKKHWALNYLLIAQWRFWSDWADAQADLSLRWAHICWFCRAAAHMDKKNCSYFRITTAIFFSCLEFSVKEGF